jgi:hypothetical protein
MFSYSPAAVLRILLLLCTPIAITLTTYVYLYPIFSQCGFPLPSSTSFTAPHDGRAAFVEAARQHSPELVRYLEEKVYKNGAVPLPQKPAPFRLLALGDPQLEGDTSIPDQYLGFFPHTRDFFNHITFQSSHWNFRQRVRWVFHDFIDIFFEDFFNLLESVRKRIDLFGNDFYLAHIYRTLHWWAKPTHITVLGDLVGSQWLTDEEFERRGVRFWKRVFKGTERVPDDVALEPAAEYDLAGFIGPSAPKENDTELWTRRIINVAGNHDIGYAGDITFERMERFERIFGKANYELRFELPLADLNNSASLSDELPDENDDPRSERLHPELRIIVINDMNLDTPAANIEIQDETYDFINKVINTAAAVEYKGHFTIILTHVPMYKPEGVCVDRPFFDFHAHDLTLKEQNQLSLDASKGFLEGIFGYSGNAEAPGSGRGRRGVMLNGHDHAGCDTYHFINQTDVYPPEREPRGWQVRKWEHARDARIPGNPDMPGMREITVRSMMGDFGGNAGLLSVWFDEESWEWQFDFATCPLGRQHLWWAVHILNFLVIAFFLAYTAIIVLTACGVDVEGWITRKSVVVYKWALEQGYAMLRLGRRLLAAIPEPGPERAEHSGGGKISSNGHSKATLTSSPGVASPSNDSG